MKKQQKNWLVAIITMILALAVIIVVFMQVRPDTIVTNFEECQDAGGAILESYPEQCLFDGKTYTNDRQPPVNIDDNYVGMTEEDALLKAKRSGTPARVVERDEELLPVTMDFIYGRHNLYIKENQVYKVEIEGQASDSPMRTK